MLIFIKFKKKSHSCWMIVNVIQEMVESMIKKILECRDYFSTWNKKWMVSIIIINKNLIIYLNTLQNYWWWTLHHVFDLFIQAKILPAFQNCFKGSTVFKLLPNFVDAKQLWSLFNHSVHQYCGNSFPLKKLHSTIVVTVALFEY